MYVTNAADQATLPANVLNPGAGTVAAVVGAGATVFQHVARNATNATVLAILHAIARKMRKGVTVATVRAILRRTASKAPTHHHVTIVTNQDTLREPVQNQVARGTGRTVTNATSQDTCRGIVQRGRKRVTRAIDQDTSGVIAISITKSSWKKHFFFFKKNCCMYFTRGVFRGYGVKKNF